MPRNLYWGKVNWNAPYSRGGLWTLNYTRSAANARPLFALLVVVYPTYFCHILCLLGVLTERYRTPVYFQHAVLFLLTRAHPRARIYYLVRGPTRSRELWPRWKWENRNRGPKTLARVFDPLIYAHPQYWFSFEGAFNTFFGRQLTVRYIFYNNYTQISLARFLKFNRCERTESNINKEEL